MAYKKINVSEGKKPANDFASLMKQGDYLEIPGAGDIVHGIVISVHRNEIKVDINGMLAGTVRGRELFKESEEYSHLKVGDEIEATVVETENEQGELELSFRVTGNQKAWNDLRDLQKSGEIIKVKVVDANKGGLMIRLYGVLGFLPVSQLKPEHYPRIPGGDKTRILERLKKYIGKDFDIKVFDASEDEEKLIVSEKSAWEDSQSGIISALKVGDIVEGEITAVTDFGAFVEFGENLEGLVHISEIAWQRIENPEDFVKVGDIVKAKIIKIDGSKVFLSMKMLQKDPWADVEKRYIIGQSVRGKVLKVNPFGLFVELDNDIHGLAHVSELSSEKNVDPLKIAQPGDEMEFTIVSIEKSDHRLGLSLKKPSKKGTEIEKPENIQQIQPENIQQQDETSSQES